MFILISTNLLDTTTSTSGSEMIVVIIVYAAVFAALYFFFIRPKSKKQKDEERMRESIEIGDEVTTIGGIVGRIVAVRDDEDAFIIETGSDRLKMKFRKWAVSTVDSEKETDNKSSKKTRGLFGRKKKDENADSDKSTKDKS